MLHTKEVQDKMDDLINLCSNEKLPATIVICDSDLKESLVSLNGTPEEIAYMGAEAIFSFAKEYSDKVGVPVNDLVKAVVSEMGKYLHVMISENDKQLELLNNPVGEA